MNLELDEELGICFDCTKQDDCPKRKLYEHDEECSDFEEAQWGLTPKGVFETVVNDMGWAELLSKDAELAWKLYEARALENALDKETFASVVTDYGWCNGNDGMIDVAFDCFVERMRKHGYIDGI